MDIFIGLVYANKVGEKGKIYMKVKKIKVLFVGLLWIFFLGTIGLSLIINGLDKVKETDTVDLPVTIRYIKLEEWSGNSRYIIIDTYEYDHPFRVHGEFDNCLKSNKMRQGNKVYLKIKKITCIFDFFFFIEIFPDPSFQKFFQLILIYIIFQHFTSKNSVIT